MLRFDNFACVLSDISGILQENDQLTVFLRDAKPSFITICESKEACQQNFKQITKEMLGIHVFELRTSSDQIQDSKENEELLATNQEKENENISE